MAPLRAFKASESNAEVKIANICLFCFRKVFFDLLFEKQAFIFGMTTLEEAVSSFLHLCFVGNFEYPIGSGNLATFLQRQVAKLDEFGTTAAKMRKDQSAKADKVSKSYKKFFDDYKEKMFLILTTKWPWYQPSEQAVFFFCLIYWKFTYTICFSLYWKFCDIIKTVIYGIILYWQNLKQPLTVERILFKITTSLQHVMF